MRRSLTITCCLFTFIPTLGAHAAQKAPSSAIPDHREFPVNDKINPCEDFYQYACSNVKETFKLRDDRSSHTFAFNDSSERLLSAKQKFLEKLTTADIAGQSKRQQDLRHVFNACMSIPANKTEELSTVAAIIKESDAITTNAQFQALIERRVISENSSVYGFDTLANQDDPAKYDFVILTNLQTLPERSYYDNPEVLKDITAVMTQFFKSIHKDHPEQRAQAVIAFEKEFAQTFPLPADFRELFSSRTHITKKELTERYPHLGLSTLLTRVPDQTLIRDITPANFAWLNDAMEHKPVQTLNDLYLWHSLSSVLDDAYPEFFTKYFAFVAKHLGGPAKRAERHERCTKMIMGEFTKEIDAELVDKIFPDFPTPKVIALTERIRSSIIAGLTKNTWLSPAARQAAITKMQKAKLQLVKPMNDDEWDFNPAGVYADDKPISNLNGLKLRLMEKELGRLSKPRNQSEWGMGPLTVNAYYSPADNKFVMPIGILQPPFFDANAPDESNLGALGAVTGHELGHGIDDKGARYDADGRLMAWMSPDDLAEFYKRSVKLIDQYNKIGHNGRLTLGENIGDLVGVTFAYSAAFPDDKGSLTAKKAFFLQYARVWCNTIRPKYRENLLKTDPHSMSEARVNEQVKHQPGFAAAYSCKPTDKLYLGDADRVRIW